MRKITRHKNTTTAKIALIAIIDRIPNQRQPYLGEHALLLDPLEAVTGELHLQDAAVALGEFAAQEHVHKLEAGLQKTRDK